MVTTPWVLQIDADERLTPTLASGITAALASDTADAYMIGFAVEFMGRVMRFSGLNHERHLRLFKNDAVTFHQDKSVHESFTLAGASRLGSLPGKMFHRPYADLPEYLRKCELYTDLAAKDFVSKGKRLSWRHDYLAAWEMFRCLFLRLGVLDGLPGFFWALLSAYHKQVRIYKIRRLLTQR